MRRRESRQLPSSARTAFTISKITCATKSELRVVRNDFLGVMKGLDYRFVAGDIHGESTESLSFWMRSLSLGREIKIQINHELM